METHGELQRSVKTATLITIVTFLSKFVGIFRDMLMVWTFGTSMGADAYTMASGVAATLTGVVGTTIGTVALPLYSDLKIKGDSEEAKNFLVNLMNILLCGSVLVFALGMLFTEPLMRLFAGGFSGEKFLLTVEMTRVTLFSIYFQVAIGVITAYLQSERKLVQIVLMNTPVNLFYIGSILLASRFGAIWLSWGLVLGAISSATLLLLTAYRYGWRWKPYINFRDPLLHQVARIMAPVWIGQVIATMNVMVDRTLASYLDEGSVAALNYANRLLGSAASLFIPTVMMMIAPIFAEMAALGPKQLLNSYSRSMRVLILLVTPLTVGAIVLTDPLVRVLYGYGAFTENDIQVTAAAMIFYAAHIFLFNALYEATHRAFISLQDTWTPLKISVITLALNIGLNLLLVRYMGVGGLALATSVSSLVWLIAGMWLLRGRLGYFGGKEMARSGLWALAASLVMAAPLLWINSFIFQHFVLRLQRIIILALEIGLGAVLYAAIISQSRVAEVDQIKALLWQQVRKALKR